MTEAWREMRIPFDDICRVGVECKCEAEITLDLHKERQLTIDWKTTKLCCPICGNEFHQKVRSALSDLSNFVVAVAESKEKVFFRLTEKENQ